MERQHTCHCPIFLDSLIASGIACGGKLKNTGGWCGLQNETLKRLAPDGSLALNFGTVAADGFTLFMGSGSDDLGNVSSAGSVYLRTVSSEWDFTGLVGGSTIDFELGGIALQVTSSPGDQPEVIAAVVAATINAEPTLAAAGITAEASGPIVVSLGVVSNKLITEAMLVPVLAPIRVVLLALVLTAASRARLRRTK